MTGLRVSVDTSTGVLYMLIDGARAAFGASYQAPHDADIIIDRDASGDVVGIRYLCGAAPIAHSSNNPDARLLPGIINAALDDYFCEDSGISLDDECRYLDGVDFDTTGTCHRCAWSVDAWYNGQPFNASSAAPGHSQDSPDR